MSKYQDKNDGTKPSIKDTILGLVVIIIIVIIGGLILKYVVTGLLIFARWVQGVASGLEAVVLVAIISAAVSLIVAFANSVLSKIIESNHKRREYLAQKREIPYQSFLKIFFKLMQGASEEENYNVDLINDTNEFSKDILLWGSPDVVRKWVTFRNACLQSSNEPMIAMGTLENLVNAMRKDLGLKKMKKNELLSVFIKVLDRK